MKQIHPGEETLQQYVLERSASDTETISHIRSCEFCKARAKVYETLFSDIKDQSAPVFDFNLSQTVLSKLPHAVKKHSRDKNYVYTIFGFSLFFIVASWLLLNRYLPVIFSGTNSLLVYLLLTTVLIVFIFHVTDIIRNYQNKIKTLDFI